MIVEPFLITRKDQDLQFPQIPLSVFEHHKLESTLAKQMGDTLTVCSGGVGIPEWCNFLTTYCPFLFSFSTRRSFFRYWPWFLVLKFRIKTLGIPRLVAQLDPQRRSEASRLVLKFRIDRSKILESARQILKCCVGRSEVLSIEYFNEPGVGSGPTREFFSLFSEEIQLTNLKLWLPSEDKPTGMFFSVISLSGKWGLVKRNSCSMSQASFLVR